MAHLTVQILFAHLVLKNPKSNTVNGIFSELQNFLSTDVCWPGVASYNDAATWKVLPAPSSLQILLEILLSSVP